MILTKSVKVKIKKDNIDYYKNKIGNDNIKCKDIVEIKPTLLTIGSGKLILVACDICGCEKEMTYGTYILSIKNGGYYSCCKCKHKKFKETFLKRYGVESPLQSKEIMNKLVNTNMERYGVKYTVLDDNVKIKMKDTNFKRYGNNSSLHGMNQEKTEKIFLEKYGTKFPSQNEEVKLKIKNTFLNKYGVESPLQSKEIMNKLVNTNMERYGVKNVGENENIKNKIKKTILKRYGVEYYFQTEEFKEKYKNYYLEKYGVENYSMSEDFKNQREEINTKIIEYKKNKQFEKYPNIVGIDYEKDEYTVYCEVCNSTYTISTNLFFSRLGYNCSTCINCNPITNNESFKEKELLEFIQNNYNDRIIINDRKILSGLELDIYLPDLNLAFEYNGLYWHSEEFKSNNYHINKTDMCETQGIKLIHIYEDEWNNKKEIIKSNILGLLNKTSVKINSKKCAIKEINSKTSKDFLDINHIQGDINSDIKLGLFYNDELVYLVVFNSNVLINEYEILRFCSKLNTTVIGGASKLFKYFVENYDPKSIITFVDRSWSSDDLYLNLGFKFIHKTKPNYDYVINGKRIDKNVFEKHILIKEGFDVNKNMQNKKYYRIFDSGSIKFIFTSQ